MFALPPVASLMASAKDPTKNKGQVLPYLGRKRGEGGGGGRETNQLSNALTKGWVDTLSA